MKLTVLVGAGLVVATALTAAQGRPKAEATPLAEFDTVRPGSTVRLALQVRLPEGLHVQSNQPRDPLLIATALTIQPPAGVTVGDVVYPPATDLTQAGQSQPLSVFEQQFLVGVTLTLDPALPPGAVTVDGRLRYQACDASTCFPPSREETRWTLTVSPEAAAVASANWPDIFKQIQFRR